VLPKKKTHRRRVTAAKTKQRLDEAIFIETQELPPCGCPVR
jgi:hypothetical protein